MRQNVLARKLASSTQAMNIAAMICGIEDSKKIENVLRSAIQKTEWSRTAA